MTENEAIRQLKYMYKTCMNEQCRHKGQCDLCYEAREIANKALEEIQQYRALGTVEEVKNAYAKGYNQGTIDRAEEITKAREYGYNKAIDEFAEKLEELKAIKSDGFTDDLLDIGYTKGYRKAIDDCKTYIGLHRRYAEHSIDDYVNYLQMASWLNSKIAEQMKAGEKQ